VEDASGTRVRYVDHGVLETGEDGPVEARLAALHAGLAAALHRHRPDVVAIEDVYQARNARSAFVLGQARGVALLAATQAGARVRSFAPSVIKKAVTGTGRAEKEQVGRMVCALLGRTVDGRLDATDALAAAICGLLRANEVQPAAAARRRGDWRAGFARSFRGRR
jgi:crossover junction endodeoxyribonuclease RuvC